MVWCWGLFLRVPAWQKLSSEVGEGSCNTPYRWLYEGNTWLYSCLCASLEGALRGAVDAACYLQVLDRWTLADETPCEEQVYGTSGQNVGGWYCVRMKPRVT